MEFQQELRELINRYSEENKSNTPDYILSQYLIDCLNAFDTAANLRDTWYGDCSMPEEKPIKTKGIKEALEEIERLSQLEKDLTKLLQRNTSTFRELIREG